MRNPLFNLPFWNETNLHVQKEIHLQRVRPFSMGAFSKTSKKTVLRGVFLLIPLTQLGLRKGDSGKFFRRCSYRYVSFNHFYKSLSKHSTSPNRVFRKKTRKNPARVPAGQNWRICQWAPTHIHCEVVLGKQRGTPKNHAFCRCVSSCEGTHFCFLAVIYSWKE